MTPKKPDWFELTDSNQASAGVKKVNKKLSIGTLVAAGAIFLGGSVFATTNNGPSAVADTPAVSESIAATQSAAVAANTPAAPVVNSVKSSTGLNSLPVPTVTNIPQRGDDDDDEYEGREGKRERGDRDHDDDEDDDEDDD
jgi:hypothetical protein